MRLNNELATMARERARRQRELERTEVRHEAFEVLMDSRADPEWVGRLRGSC